MEPHMSTALHLARARDPLTSHLAAQRSRTFATGHAERVCHALATCLQITPEKGATAAEIATEADLTIEQCCRRLPELLKAGRVRVLVDEHGYDVIRAGFRCWGLV
jgi:hypothetical protein